MEESENILAIIDSLRQDLTLVVTAIVHETVAKSYNQTIHTSPGRWV